MTKPQAEPFLALCHDREGEPEGFEWTLYFVNPGDAPIEALRIESRGRVMLDDELVQTSTSLKGWERVGPGEVVEVERDDDGEFDFAVTYLVSGRRRGETIQTQFYRRAGLRGHEERWVEALAKDGIVLVAEGRE